MALPSCPHCGDDPKDDTLHRQGCPTLGTCAQTRVNLSKPWHHIDEWYAAGSGKYLSDLDAHVATSHRLIVPRTAS